MCLGPLYIRIKELMCLKFRCEMDSMDELVASTGAPVEDLEEEMKKWLPNLKKLGSNSGIRQRGAKRRDGTEAKPNFADVEEKLIRKKKKERKDRPALSIEELVKAPRSGIYEVGRRFKIMNPHRMRNTCMTISIFHAATDAVSTI